MMTNNTTRFAARAAALLIAAIRWGKYADLVVTVAGGRQFVFSRATGYLPYLQTPKGKFPIEQSAKCLPDPMCLCSYLDGIGGGWQDTQFLSQAGTTCLDTIELTALSVANMSGGKIA